MPNSDTENQETGETMREKWIERAWQSGPTTVAFFMLLLGAGYKAEAMLDRIDQGYARNAAALQKAAETNALTIDRVIAQWREDRKILLDILHGRNGSARDDDNGSSVTPEELEGLVNGPR